MTNTPTTTNTPAIATGERADLLASLAQARHFLRFTVRELTDEQAARRTTVSELCLGGLIKHVAAVESNWVDFILGGPDAMSFGDAEWDGGEWNAEQAAEQWSAQFQLQPGETLAGVLGHYEQVARRTDEVVTTLPDLDVSHALPKAPWFEPGARWSARRTLLHIIAETAQHSGHADILRESLDGSRTMG